MSKKTTTPKATTSKAKATPKAKAKTSKVTTPKSTTSKRAVTKGAKVLTHLLKKKSITSWEAITLYKATRLSAIIFILRKNGYGIATNDITSRDTNGNSCTFAKYILTSLPK